MESLDAQDRDERKASLIRQLLGLPEGASMTAAEQVVRTRVSPDHFQAVAALNKKMHQSGPRFVRSVAEWMGYDTLRSYYPAAQDGRHLIDEYQAGVGDSHELADLFRELAVFAALTNQDQHFRVYAAVIAASTSDTLCRRFHGRAGLSSEVFWNEIAEMRTQADHEQVLGQRAQWVSDVQPLHAAVREPVEENQYRIAFYRVPATVRIYDPVTRTHDIEFNQPHEVERYVVERELTIPWQRAQTGVQLELALGASAGHHPPERYFLTAAQLEQLRRQGTAIHTRIGRWDDIRFYPEYVQAIPGESAVVPDHSLVSIRLTLQAVEIRKLDRSTQLTVYV